MIITDIEIQGIFSKILFNSSTDCWEWLAAKQNQGYGVINFRGKTTRVHRLLYEFFIRKLPPYDGINVLDHVVCDNRACCNPQHVKLVKQSFNVLRANSVSGANSRKTHCHKGHLLPEPNERMTNGKLMRRCLTCRRKNSNRRYHARKGHS